MVAIKLLLEMNSLDKVGILENQSRSFSMLVRQDQRVRQLQLFMSFQWIFMFRRKSVLQ